MAPSNRRPLRRPLALLALGSLAIALAGVPRPAAAVSVSDVADAAFDVVVLRPLHAAALVLGPVFFVAAVPFVAPFERREGIETAWDIFVVAPYEYTVTRDLGDF